MQQPVPAQDLDQRQHATILAALRYWQREGLSSNGHEVDIATDGGTLEPLSASEIDDLCVAMNAFTVPVVVLETEGGAIHCASSNMPVRVVVLDEDTEGADSENLRQVNGSEVYLIDRMLDMPASISGEGVDEKYVSQILDQLAAQET